MDTSKIRDLWRRAFGDSEQYMDYYFSHKLPISRVYLGMEKEELVSMASFTPYSVKFMGQLCKSYYIEGVATEEKYRGRHKMKNLLQTALEKCQEVPLVFLCPENPDVYRSLGFVPTYWRETTYVKADSLSAFETTPKMGKKIRAWQELDAQKKEKVSAFANQMLERENFDLYIEHSPAYYENVSLELKALDGNLLTVWDRSGEVCAVADIIFEENTHQLTEIIVRREDAESVVYDLLLYLNIDFLQIDDSYFLGQLSGKGIIGEKQEKPYIMYRMLSGKSPEIRCYINDIT